MIPVLLIAIPLLSGIVSFFLKREGVARIWALLSSLATLTTSVLGLTCFSTKESLYAHAEWLPLLGSSFSVGLDGMGQVLGLLTALSFSVIFIATYRSVYTKAHNFFALMLLSQAGLMGVFVAFDALLFYFFWELALIPVYFLCSQWGGERRIQVTIKFFIYTFIGSLLMLIGLIYVHFKTPDQSFALESFYNVVLTNSEQSWLFWLLFIAFAIKMPVFPFHTWQPDTYEQSNTAVTMVLSGIMVKMGIFGLLRWLAPVLPIATWAWGDTISTLCVIGMIYASLVAMKQDDLKRLIAYSSIVHVGLMCLAIFATNEMAIQGAIIQMFNHGVNIIGLWIVVELIERQFGTRKISELGGLAQKAPAMAVLLVILSLANVALPITNSFVGEFLMFSGVFNSTVSHYNIIFAVLALVTIILSAVYTLNMIQRVFLGNTNTLTERAKDIFVNEKLVLWALVAIIIFLGVYPKPLLEVSQSTVDAILTRMISKHP
ncbi:MAG TPA: NADH-quinone oxidoreductase subunit M [Flavitalea sp.]|nr:NADH-quinone oxidoreductase subunit M [Flavitalea sp.]